MPASRKISVNDLLSVNTAGILESFQISFPGEQTFCLFHTHTYISSYTDIKFIFTKIRDGSYCCGTVVTYCSHQSGVFHSCLSLNFRSQSSFERSWLHDFRIKFLRNAKSSGNFQTPVFLTVFHQTGSSCDGHFRCLCSCKEISQKIRQKQHTVCIVQNSTSFCTVRIELR